MLSYFGTDQSQVQRYLSGRSVREIKTGLYFNAVLKIPMQFFILFIGAMVFVFYQLHTPPIHFDGEAIEQVRNSEGSGQLVELEEEHAQLYERIRNATMDESTQGSTIAALQKEKAVISKKVEALVETSGYVVKAKESDYVFITYVLRYLPIGLVGLIMAVLFSAAMSSTSAELNALGSTALVDFYKQRRPDASDAEQLRRGKLLTAFYGVLAIAFAISVNFLENLVEAVNILGSLFYGTILGVFVVGFFLKWIKATPVFIAAIVAELVVISFFIFDRQIDALLGYKIEYLWYNLIGCLLVVLISWVLNFRKSV